MTIMNQCPRLRPLVARLALCLALLGTSCRQLELRPAQVSSTAVLLAVPMVEQDELHECGLASVSALCEYHGVPIPADERGRLVAAAAENQGLTGGELRRLLEALGLEVFLFRGTLDHEVSGLYHHIDRGRPLLVMLSSDGEAHHYCLFTGYDPAYGNVFLLDPGRGSLAMTTADVEALWAESGYFTLLCAPPLAAASGKLPSPTTVSRSRS